MVVCGDFEEDFLEFPPAIIFEILSKPTHLKDRNIKSKIYQAYQVKYYCLVNPQSQIVEIFVLKNGVYELVLETSTERFLFSFHHCKVEIDFSKIWKK
jgi:Uma2 family endonuclease